MAKKRVRFHEHGLHDDIRYSGPLSFQTFQILGWLCIVLTVVMALMKAAIGMNPGDSSRFSSAITAISYVSNLSLPFLLMANFARILNNYEGYKKQLIRNGGAMAAIAVVSVVFFRRYIIGTIGLLLENSADAQPLVMDSFYQINKNGFFAFNIFVDLLLCTLFMYFMNARPKRVFTGKKVLILRAFAVLPVAYEAGSILLKALSALGRVRIPYWAFPLLTVKPPMTFVVFVMLAIYIKTRELRYCRHGKTHEDYQAFLKTNRNALHFSIYTAVIMLIAGLVDLFILTYLLLRQSGGSEEVFNGFLASEAALKHTVALAVGFGNSIILILFAPIVLLFNYTKIPKNKTVSMLIPMIGIVLILLIIIQGMYQLVAIAPIPKMNGQELKEMLDSVFSVMSGV